MPTRAPSSTRPRAQIAISPQPMPRACLLVFGQSINGAPWTPGTSPHKALGGGLRMPRLSLHQGLGKEVTTAACLLLTPGRRSNPQRPGFPGPLSEQRSLGLSSGLRRFRITPQVAPSNKRTGLQRRPPGPPESRGNPEATRPAPPCPLAPQHDLRDATGPPCPQRGRRPLTHPAMAALGLRLRRPGPGASIAVRGGRRRARAGHHD